MKTGILLALILISTTFLPAQELEATIAKLNRQMEEFMRNGQLRELSQMYLDEAVLISPGNAVVTGRENIDSYWTGIREPVDWKLEIIHVTGDENEIYDHPYWKSLETKPPGWKPYVTIEDDDELVFELGHSTLVTIWEDEERTSEVDFLLVWKNTESGFRILVDTYSW